MAISSPRVAGSPRSAELAGDVLRRAQQQEPEACRLLFRRYQAPVHALVYRMLGLSHGVALVEDISQETFLRVFRHLSDFDPERGSRLSAWILTIAARLALNALRRRPHEPLQHEVAELKSAFPAQRELAECVANALLALPANHRAAFLLREYHGLDYSEIAVALNVSIGTVKSRLSRARVELRKSLSEYKA